MIYDWGITERIASRLSRVCDCDMVCLSKHKNEAGAS